MRPFKLPQELPATYPKFWETIKSWLPVYIAPKLDGIRAISADQVYSKTMKPIPSSQVQDSFSNLEFLDGELIVGDETDEEVCRRTMSHTQSFNKPSDQLKFRVFDIADPDTINLPFFERYDNATSIVATSTLTGLSIVPHKLVYTMEELHEEAQRHLEEGYEGSVIRHPEGVYKYGRATMLERNAAKLKNLITEEGTVIGFEERKKNLNEAYINEEGFQKRSTHQENMVGAGMVGKFIVDFKGLELRIGGGKFTHDELLEIWLNQSEFIGKKLQFTYFGYGVKDMPRQPKAKMFRPEWDI